MTRRGVPPQPCDAPEGCVSSHSRSAPSHARKVAAVSEVSTVVSTIRPVSAREAINDRVQA